MPQRTSTLRWLLRAASQRARVISQRARQIAFPARVSSTRAQGTIAEELVEAHLRTLGYTPRARSAVTRKGEADLLMQAPTGELVIVEVKSRVRTSDASARSNAASPELAMTDDKRRRLLDIKRDLGRRNPHERFRVDLVAVELDEQNNVLAMRHYPSIV